MTASGEAPIQTTAIQATAIQTTAPAIRVLHLAQSDGGGGANKAAFRLHRSLRDLGVGARRRADVDDVYVVPRD